MNDQKDNAAEIAASLSQNVDPVRPASERPRSATVDPLQDTSKGLPEVPDASNTATSQGVIQSHHQASKTAQQNTSKIK